MFTLYTFRCQDANAGFKECHPGPIGLAEVTGTTTWLYIGCTSVAQVRLKARFRQRQRLAADTDNLPMTTTIL